MESQVSGNILSKTKLICSLLILLWMTFSPAQT